MMAQNLPTALIQASGFQKEGELTPPGVPVLPKVSPSKALLKSYLWAQSLIEGRQSGVREESPDLKQGMARGDNSSG
jgi:hypothetical protein